MQILSNARKSRGHLKLQRRSSQADLSAVGPQGQPKRLLAFWTHSWTRRGASTILWSVVHNLRETEGDTHDDRMAADRARLVALFRETLMVKVSILTHIQGWQIKPRQAQTSYFHCGLRSNQVGDHQAGTTAEKQPRIFKHLCKPRQDKGRKGA